MDLRREIDLAIMDIRDKNYGIAEERLFKFLDLLDGTIPSSETEVGSQPDNTVFRDGSPEDPAAEYRAKCRTKYSVLDYADPDIPGYMGDSY